MDHEPYWTWWDEARVIARRHARGASDAADDLAQELAVAVLERGADVRRPGPWLERVGRNAEIDRWRVAERRRELVAEIAPPLAPPDPEARVLLRERRGVLRGALATLPRPLRRAALARFHADLPFEAVASRLGTRMVTARTRVHRALARLRARVGGLRALFVWLPGAQATVLGVTIMAGLAEPALVPIAVAPTPEALPRRAPAHGHRVAAAPSGTPVAAPPEGPGARPAPSRAPHPTSRDVETVQPPSAVQRFSYDDDAVTGDLARPDESLVQSLPATPHLSLIELRRQFIPEILKTLEDL
ncbi:MAG TPA: sigma-70 family RNA polymerase sigma factor [Polyangia bacterium]|nr:sigma-70 family RNA polymerase sigma factor [Polyangia bacterium]